MTVVSPRAARRIGLKVDFECGATAQVAVVYEITWLTVEQLFHMRPAPGYADFRTPIRGLYNGSSATHGGGGVNGIAGMQAFRQARRDGMASRT